MSLKRPFVPVFSESPNKSPKGGGLAMSYRNTLQVVDTAKAFEVIGIEFEKQGGYLKFKCPSCDNYALIKVYGDKKNLYYCPKCKASGHIINLAVAIKELEWKEAEVFLLAKAQGVSQHKITQELTMTYELQYTDWLSNRGISQETARNLGIGIPRGKTMLAGCCVFAVHDENGIKVAYYGIKMKDYKPVFYKSFNPELYLYNYFRINPEEEVYLTTDLYKCAKMINDGLPTICNFNLPYLSNQQLELINRLEKVIFKVHDSLINFFAVQLATLKKGFYHFE